MKQLNLVLIFVLFFSSLAVQAVVVEVPKSKINLEDSNFGKAIKPLSQVEFSYSDISAKGLSEPSLIANTQDLTRSSGGKYTATFWRQKKAFFAIDQYLGLGFSFLNLNRKANLGIGRLGNYQISQDLQFYQLKLAWRFITEYQFLGIHPYLEFSALPSFVFAPSSQFGDGITESFLASSSSAGLFLDIGNMKFLLGVDSLYSSGKQKISEVGLFTGVNFGIDLL